MSILEAINQENNKIVPIEPNVTDKDYFIPEAMKRDLEGLLTTIQNISDFGEMGHRNFLFSGLPGTGKTLGVMYVATKLQGLVHDAKSIGSAEDVQSLFKDLRETAKTKNKPIFLIVNEIDKFSNRSTLIDPSQRAFLNTLLDEMDGFEKNDNIYIIGTTNRPNDLDPALRRPGRFDREIEFLPPDLKGRLAILEIHAYNKKHNFKITKDQLKKVSEKTFGYTGADIRGLLSGIFEESMIHKRKEVSDEDIAYGLKHTMPSAIKDMPFKEPTIKLADLVGYEAHKEVLKRIIEKNNGANMLFYGPPGTGKSVFSEALAGEYGYNLIYVSGSELESKWVGETKDRLAEVYKRAKSLAPCIITLDEIDSFIETKGSISHQKEQTGYMQSVFSKPIDGVWVIATTNNPQFLRPVMIDRFMFKLYFGLPGKDEIRQLLKKYLPEKINLDDIKLEHPVSCRDVWSAGNKAKTYGVDDPKGISSFLNITRGEEDYKKVIGQIGDDVADYKALRGEK
jgi:transitional endoplasmic reticulum ATPase